MFQAGDAALVAGDMHRTGWTRTPVVDDDGGGKDESVNAPQTTRSLAGLDLDTSINVVKNYSGFFRGAGTSNFLTHYAHRQMLPHHNNPSWDKKSFLRASGQEEPGAQAKWLP